MEDRKRPIHDQSDVAPPSKKQATSANGAKSRDEDMPWKDDLEKFQKDAIYRQMQEYKRERNTLETTVKELRKKTRDHDEHLQAIDSWLKQLIDEVQLIVPADSDEMEVDSSPSSLSFTEQKDLEQHLAGRAQDIRSLVTRLFRSTSSFTPEVRNLQSKVSSLLAAEKGHLTELDRLRAEVRDFDDRLQTASLRYMVAEKKLDRARSVTAAKLEKGLLLGSNQASSDELSSVKREESALNGATDHGEELAELEQEIKKTAAASEKQKEQISRLEEENAKLVSKVTELSTKTKAFTDEDYAKTDLYKQLKSQHDDAVRKLNDLEAMTSELRQEHAKLLEERTLFQANLEQEGRTVNMEKDAQLGQVSVDLARIRNHRDELLADQAIKKASLDERSEALAKLKDLTLAQEERIKALESENERLAVQGADPMAVGSDLDAVSAEELRSRHAELQKKYRLLNGELASMQTAFQKSSRLASQKVTEYSALEDKVQRLTAEKSKADQKYFAAMKSKETRDTEIRTLRMQNSKSSEVVSQLREVEASSRSLIANLEKQVSEVRSALTTKTGEHRAASQQTASQGSELSRANAQLADVKQQIQGKDIQLASTASACRSAEVEVEELKASLADVRRNLESWKSKSGQSEQYEALRSFAYCNVCKKELKNTVIKTCGHTFCHHCVEERLQLRARKCPNCNRAFGNNDYMRITL